MEIIDRKARIEELITDEYISLHKDKLNLMLEQSKLKMLFCKGIYCHDCPIGFNRESFSDDCMIIVDKQIVQEAITERLSEYEK
jgi:isochorismate hydrolase